MARIVFDLDGTLIDSIEDVRGVANAVLAGEGAAPLSRDEARAFIGNGAPVFVERMRAARGIGAGEQARLLADFVERYDRAVELTEPFPGVPGALERLRASGHRLGICTNKPLSPARAVLAHLGMDGFFEVVLGGDSAPRPKPDPHRCGPRSTGWARGRASMSATARSMPRPPCVPGCRSCCIPRAISRPRQKR